MSNEEGPGCLFAIFAIFIALLLGSKKDPDKDVKIDISKTIPPTKSSPSSSVSRSYSSNT